METRTSRGKAGGSATLQIKKCLQVIHRAAAMHFSLFGCGKKLRRNFNSSRAAWRPNMQAEGALMQSADIVSKHQNIIFPITHTCLKVRKYVGTGPDSEYPEQEGA